MDYKKNYAIVLAGGKGSRMESDIPKQYINIDGDPVLYYSLKAFEDFDAVTGLFWLLLLMISSTAGVKWLTNIILPRLKPLSQEAWKDMIRYAMHLIL